jgi:aminoglycoside phosphotransferase
VDHLALEYLTTHGRLVAGQWFGRSADLQQAAQETMDTCLGQARDVAVLPRLGVLLQVNGADRRLPGLAALLSETDAQLLVHRPERRAVVWLKGRPSQPYAKIMPPHRVQTLAKAGQRLQWLADGILAIPRLVAVNPVTGVLIWSQVFGSSLHHLLRACPGDLSPRAPAIGRALRAFHQSEPHVAVRPHNAVAETAVLHRWIERVGWFDPQMAARLGHIVPGVCARLAFDSSPQALIHRDLHDKQVLLDRSTIGLIDLDTLAVGEAALDLANLLVHLELRVLQGWASQQWAVELAAAIIKGYRPDQCCWGRLLAYGDAARLRLACVYFFRPRYQAVVVSLLNRLGVPLLSFG